MTAITKYNNFLSVPKITYSTNCINFSQSKITSTANYNQRLQL